MKAKIFFLSALVAVGMAFTGCDDDHVDSHDPIDTSVSNQVSVNAPVADEVQPTFATLTASFTMKGDYKPGGLGFCYSTTQNPDIYKNKVVKSDSYTENTMTATIEGLQPNTVYYVRAYVYVNKGDLVYSPEFVLDTANVTEKPSEGETPEGTPEETPAE